ncbi:MAG: hypothetical protein Tsb0021_17880 [Chlamydiales bacterium]
MIRKRTSFITMLEILLAIGILSLITGVIAFSISGLINQQNYYRSVDIVTEKLQTALNLMLILDSETTVVLNQVDGNYEIKLETEKNIDPIMGRNLKEKEPLRGLSQLKFEGESFTTLELKFSAINQSIPRGTLHLEGRRSDSDRYISLKGYPHPIEAKFEMQKEKPPEDESAVYYPKEIRETWLLEKKT